MEDDMKKVRVRFIKDMHPYKEGEEGEVAQMIVNQYPDHVVPVGEVKTKKEAPVAKAMSEAPNDKMIHKAPHAKTAAKKKASK